MSTSLVSASAGVPLGIGAVTTSTFIVCISAMARRSAPDISRQQHSTGARQYEGQDGSDYPTFHMRLSY